MARKGRILVVDDEQGFCELLESVLQKEGFEVISTTDPEKCITLLEEEDIDIVFLDYKMPGCDGITVLKRIKEHDENIVAIIITAYGSIETAVEAMKYGAYDFITKPFQKNDLVRLTQKAWDKRKLMLEMSHLWEEIQDRYGFNNIIGKSKPMQDLFDLIRRAANSRCTVVIQGESGTGKELVAKAIHYNSPRKHKKIVCVNAATLQDTLLESQLFGHVKGAFTGAYKTQKGFFETADGGTLFLDEIAEISPNIQAKLLRVLQEHEIVPVGSTTPVKVDVRLLVATNKDLKTVMEDGKFREDLYYRLNVLTVTIPPLRDRVEDIPLLAMHFLQKYAEESGKDIHGFTPMAMEMLCSYPWPGNVRELENVIEAAISLETSDKITTRYLNYDGRLSSLPKGVKFVEDNRILPYADAKKRFEREYILTALERCSGNVSLAARQTGIIRTNLYKKLKKLDIKVGKAH